MNGRLLDMGRDLVLYLVTMLMSLSVHEYCHAVVANALGDDTPRNQGRLTLSPLAHYDVLGTFIVPIVAIVAGGIPFIGWARPVETNPSNYTRRISMRNGHRLVAVAGPLSNLVLAILSMAALTLLVRIPAATGGSLRALEFLLAALVRVNVGLCVLNLIPIPPLDGSRLLPRSMDELQAAIAPFSFIIILVVLNVSALERIFFWPVSVLGGALQAIFGLDVGLA